MWLWFLGVASIATVTIYQPNRFTTGISLYTGQMKHNKNYSGYKHWQEMKRVQSTIFKKNDKCKARTMANSRVVLWKWQVCLHVDYKSKIRCLSSETANVGNEYSKWSENFWNNPIQHRFSTLLPSENILTSPPIHQDSEHRRLHEAVHPIYGLFWKHGLAAKHRSLFL